MASQEKRAEVPTVDGWDEIQAEAWKMRKGGEGKLGEEQLGQRKHKDRGPIWSVTSSQGAENGGMRHLDCILRAMGSYGRLLSKGVALWSISQIFIEYDASCSRSWSRHWGCYIWTKQKSHLDILELCHQHIWLIKFTLIKMKWNSRSTSHISSAQ